MVDRRIIVKLEKEKEEGQNIFLAWVPILIAMFCIVLPARYAWQLMDQWLGPLTIRIEVVNVQK